jgi:hypothetical protein
MPKETVTTLERKADKKAIIANNKVAELHEENCVAVDFLELAEYSNEPTK